jgi:spore cortex biosynthesis protein YabQ
MNREIIVFLVMILCGGALSALFDLFRAAKNVLKPPHAVIALSDLLFWLMAGFAVTACVWNFNSGIVRFYEPLGLVLGSIFYFLLLGRVIFKFFLLIFENILKIVGFIFKILLTPWTFLYKILVEPIKHGEEMPNAQEAEK